MVGFLGTEDFGGDSGFLQYGTEALGLGRVIWMIIDVQDQKWRDSLALGHMRYGRKVAVFFGVIAEFFTVRRVSAVVMMAGTS